MPPRSRDSMTRDPYGERFRWRREKGGRLERWGERRPPYEERDPEDLKSYASRALGSEAPAPASAPASASPASPREAGNPPLRETGLGHQVGLGKQTVNNDKMLSTNNSITGRWGGEVGHWAQGGEDQNEHQRDPSDHDSNHNDPFNYCAIRDTVNRRAQH